MTAEGLKAGSPSPTSHSARYGNSFATVSAPENVRVSAGTVPRRGAKPEQNTGIATPKNEKLPISTVLAGSNVVQSYSIESEPPELSATVFVTAHETLIAGHHCPAYWITGS